MFCLSSLRGFSFVDNDEMLRGVTRSFSRAINYTREANLSESIIIAVRQNYVLTRASRCSRRCAVINYGQLDRFITFSARREALYRVTLYEASGFDEVRRRNV